MQPISPRLSRKQRLDVHLLDVSDRLVAALAGAFENRHERAQGKPWSIIKCAAARPFDPIISLKMALLANGIAKRRVKVAGG